MGRGGTDGLSDHLYLYFDMQLRPHLVPSPPSLNDLTYISVNTDMRVYMHYHLSFLDASVPS